MALQLPHRTHLRRTAIAAVLGAALISPATAPAAKAKRPKAKPAPTVTSVRPMQLSVGELLEIRGRNFLRGRDKNTVVFQRDGAKAVFAKAEIGTTKLLRVRIPEKLAAFLVTRDGAPAATKFRIRILSARFGKRFTKDVGSPTIHPAGSVATPGGAAPVTLVTPGGQAVAVEAPKAAPADGDCDSDKTVNGVDADDDNDLLDDALELSLGLEPCKPDTDGDAVGDGYEYQSARDLNDDEYQEANTYLPYPGKRPYPNPLDGTDATVDFDGDSLTLDDEWRLWKAFDTSRDLGALLYSDGNQCSLHERRADGRRICTLTMAEYRAPAKPGEPATRHRQGEFLGWAASAGYARVSFDGQTSYDLLDFDHSGGAPSTTATGDYERSEVDYYDLDGNGVVTDDERDEDADGLTNFDESTGRMLPSWWAGRYSNEAPYYVAYKGTDLADGDSDGDGVRDGADDQDHDDFHNLSELSRNAASGRALESPVKPPSPPNPFPWQGHVNPYNPCLPYTGSRTCNNHPPFSGAWAPFAEDEKIYYVFN
ncbi:MAG: hypothetical protein AVDCRST_MAG30-4113 [uncultured Solirubrobacteraceae bacterium]|uniref:IPT/TIG domain-containing protein n=1 Tax=uncultured Solirubrobacteraceae bacterium TaxID=1162706 RepID=A0A6J4TXX8_9ACTN|nr:MAG: hypothetical protein AVDCRST_MAG30-4113 [uncultured Solirubrobacteraceae bacterium]